MQKDPYAPVEGCWRNSTNKGHVEDSLALPWWLINSTASVRVAAEFCVAQNPLNLLARCPQGPWKPEVVNFRGVRRVSSSKCSAFTDSSSLSSGRRLQPSQPCESASAAVSCGGWFLWSVLTKDVSCCTPCLLLICTGHLKSHRHSQRFCWVLAELCLPCAGAGCAFGPFSPRGKFPHLLAEVLLDRKLGVCLWQRAGAERRESVLLRAINSAADSEPVCSLF